MNLFEQVQDGYVDNAGVTIHYVTLGRGPLMILIHGFPEFWYSWRHQMPELAEQFQVVAVDLRGYNLSDKPAGVEAYKMRHLVGDIVALIGHLGANQAAVVGHDWGGMVAWTLAMFHPELVERLIICNLPHPTGLARELAHNPQQQQNSQYAREFQAESAHERLTVEQLTAWIREAEARPHYRAALLRSDLAALLNYYKANYPRPPYTEPASAPPKIQCPVLLIHGLADTFLLPGALNNTWEWLDQDLTLVTVPGAGHFVHQDAPDFVTRSMVMWLGR
jgi:pimeloyl-ACP methyl ester carboxylesterase